MKKLLGILVLGLLLWRHLLIGIKNI